MSTDSKSRNTLCSIIRFVLRPQSQAKLKHYGELCHYPHMLVASIFGQKILSQAECPSTKQEKIFRFFFVNSIKQTVPKLSFFQGLSFECAYSRISSTDSKVRTTLYSTVNSTTRKLLLSSFHLNGHTLGFHPQTQKSEPPCIAQ